MTKLANYLERIQLQEQKDSLKSAILIYIIFIITTTILLIMSYYFPSKRNIHLEAILRKITGKKYFVRILEEQYPNAFCFGGFGSTIFLTNKLVNILNEKEVIAVCLHEIGHITTYDSLKNLGIRFFSIGAAGIFYSKLLSKMNYSLNSKVKQVAVLSTAIIISILIVKSPAILIGKFFEYRADKHASKYGYGKELASALEKIEKWIKEYKYKIFGKPSKLGKMFDKINNFIDVHPTFQHRIEKLLEYEKLYEAMADNDIKQIKKICKEVLTTG